MVVAELSVQIDPTQRMAATKTCYAAPRWSPGRSKLRVRPDGGPVTPEPIRAYPPAGRDGHWRGSRAGLVARADLRRHSVAVSVQSVSGAARVR